MNIKLEILSNCLTDAILYAIRDMEFNDDMVDSTAVCILEEIKQIIQNDNIEDNFDVVEEIVCVFEKYNIYAGGRHDF